jgi:hypothetical protein
MNSECVRIADQLRRAFGHDPWHGPPLSELLDGLTAEQARSHPVPGVHSIWELVLHIDLYVRVALDAIRGLPQPKLYETKQDWPSPGDDGEQWESANRRLFEAGEQLAQAIEIFGDQRLSEISPGRDYDFYYLFHGIVQHSLYHGGQIALLKKQLGPQAGTR